MKHVARQAKRSAAALREPVRKRFRRGSVAVGDGHRGAAPGDGRRCGIADPTRTSHEQQDAIGEIALVGKTGGQVFSW